jgi:Photosynthesis system II assembly factor YCF48
MSKWVNPPRLNYVANVSEFRGVSAVTKRWIAGSNARFASRSRRVVAMSLATSLISVFLVVGTTQGASFAVSTSSFSSSLRLESVDFSSPSDGFGAFQWESLSGRTCKDYVGRTENGGATFSPLVHVMSWDCANRDFDTELTSDGRGDLFLFGPQLYVSHNNALTWSAASHLGPILDVDAVGRSIWALRSICTSAEVARSTPCGASLLESTNGGRTWQLSPSPWGSTNEIADDPATMQTYLVRLSQDTAYVMLSPSPLFSGKPSTTPLWFTTNGGRTWANREAPCHIGAWSAAFSVAPDGTLMTVCASQPSAGMQLKTVLESSNGGRSWTLKAGGSGTSFLEIDDGYLGSIDLLSKNKAFLVGGRSSLMETLDGGATWKAVQPHIGSTAGGTFQVTFFGGSDGLVLGNNDNDNERMTLWKTIDAGASWKVVIPKTAAPSNDDSMSKGLQ